MLERLAGRPEYGVAATPYARAADEWFAPYAGAPAVVSFRELLIVPQHRLRRGDDECRAGSMSSWHRAACSTLARRAGRPLGGSRPRPCPRGGEGLRVITNGDFPQPRRLDRQAPRLHQRTTTRKKRNRSDGPTPWTHSSHNSHAVSLTRAKHERRRPISARRVIPARGCCYRARCNLSSETCRPGRSNVESDGHLQDAWVWTVSDPGS